MSTIKIKRKDEVVGVSLPYGELGIAQNKFYFGNKQNAPIQLALESDVVKITGAQSIGGAKTFTSDISTDGKIKIANKFTIEYNSTNESIDFIFI